MRRLGDILYNGSKQSLVLNPPFDSRRWHGWCRQRSDSTGWSCNALIAHWQSILRDACGNHFHTFSPLQTLARVVEATERHYKAAGRRSGLPLPVGPIEDRDHFRVWPKVCSHSQPMDCTESMQPGSCRFAVKLPSNCQ